MSRLPWWGEAQWHRWRSRLWRWLPLVCYAAAALALALAAAARSEAPVRNEIIFILDVSASVSEIPAEVLRFCRRLAQSAERVQTVWAAGTCRLAPAADRELALPRREEIGEMARRATDLESAIRFAANLPRGGRVRRRLFLLSDGRETRGHALAAARSLAGAARLDTMAIGNRPRRDARLLSLVLPARALSGQPLA
ncbi:MAG: VWA domain-containing protein, partial [Planctomycetota bacterium]|nr:VWA domain-containing protein [Planctomycetota bacterium]